MVTKIIDDKKRIITGRKTPKKQDTIDKKIILWSANTLNEIRKNTEIIIKIKEYGFWKVSRCWFSKNKHKNKTKKNCPRDLVLKPKFLAFVISKL